LTFPASIFKIYASGGRQVVARIRVRLFIIVAASIATVLSFGLTHAAGNGAIDDTPPITGGDAQRQNMLPPRPWQTLPHEAYATPAEATALPTPAAEASPAAQSNQAGASAAPAPIYQIDHHRDADNEATPGEMAYLRTHDLSYADPLSWSVMVYKKRHQLIVYYKGRRYRTYDAVFGRNLDDGTKEYEGDRRTPEGVYTIIEKHRSSRWRWFLTLNYPNLVDRLRYDELIDDEVIPVHGGHVVGVGGRIGIHGTDEPVLNRGNVNWTTGCISVDNDAIVRLYKVLPVGTIVIIKP
jgi:lipoprotein-anchoring transpeptidase ErfK/SrfK